MGYPIPPDEEARLEQLRRYRILDTLPEAEFDDIARIASFVCGVPIAQVNFIDAERQWQKASVGLPAGSDPRSVSFCAHSILTPSEILEVQDARHHPVFRGYPNVTGEPLIVFYAGAPLVTRDGSAIGTLCVVDLAPHTLTPAQAEVLRALARQVVALLELRLARAWAEEQAAARASFLATMAHEIRTPLNGVLGTADLLADTPLDAAQRELVSTLRASGGHLLGVVNDVLDLSWLESGTARFERAPFRADEALRTAVAMVAPAAQARALRLVVEIDASVAQTVEGDAARLRQVALNLLSNAVKFTHQGEVGLSARLADGALRLRVWDTGIGIEPSRLPDLFAPFRQADPSTHRRFGGTGLGLSITKKLIEGQGGSIRATSAPGRGTAFEVEIPMPLARPSEPAGTRSPDERAEIAPLRILVAEDDPVNRKVMEGFLRRLGQRAVFVEDGRAAVAACAKERFDLVLMDVQMPIMDGLEATRAIRAAHARPPRIVACTAHTLAEEDARCGAAGMEGPLRKPLRAAELEALLREVAASLKADRPTA